MSGIVECVPNFSEGRNKSIIDAIARSIENTNGVKLLDVDPGADTNRTVMTFVGPPDAVIEAAFMAIKTASELIDMRQHHGAHARIGATDVCPLVPVAGISMEECVRLAHALGKRVGEELKIPVFLYEAAASVPERTNLADIRKGEYEGLAARLNDPVWKPDYGPAEFNPRSGATVIGAREFLIAYNINLNTRDQKLAHKVALNIREAGRAKRDEHGNLMRDSAGNTIKEPGTLRAVKAVGWYIPEYGRAQISMNLVNSKITPPHLAFDECCQQAAAFGLRVTGSELIGLIPLEAMLEAGRYFLRKQGKSAGVPDTELIHIAVQSMGLNEINPFDPMKKIIEYQLAPPFGPLAQMSVTNFVDETSMDSPAPGGGSVSATAGAMGAALAAMVCNLTIGKKGYETVSEFLKPLAEEAQKSKNNFLKAIDLDTEAFNAVMAAFSLPKSNELEKTARATAIQDANKGAVKIPLSVMQMGVELLEKIVPVAENGNSNALSDIGVAALMLRSAAEGAFLNVKINLPNIVDQDFVNTHQIEADKLLSLARIAERKILDIVEQRMNRK
ncbi:glutamate formimidoyltransferase [candidate division KSB1 bacterium]|nr:glutamate formimidoyltransferase [candidate division KSB1 bacterium]